MIFTLIMISLLTMLVTYMANRTIPYVSYTSTLIDREKAKLLALGGIQMGLSRLAWAAADEKKEKSNTKTGKKEQPEEKDKRFLQTILPYLNRCHKFSLTKEKDGINGEIHLIISCENGKLNINEIYDFDKHVFVGKGSKNGQDYEKIMEAFFKDLEKKGGGKELFKSFSRFLKNRKYKLNDVTELLEIKAFEHFKNRIFYEPPSHREEKKSEEQKKPIFYLTDIFTVWSGRKDIQPWLLSDSMCGLLNLDTAKTDDIEKRTKKIKKSLEQFTIKTTWENDWNKKLTSVYGKNFNIVPKFIKPILATRFGPTVFSVLSYGKVGEVTQRFLAIVEKGKPSQEQDGRANVTIRKLYWF